MTIPRFVELSKDNKILLSKTLLADKPQEGCALLIGKEMKSQKLNKEIYLKIEFIWPCCNIWKPDIYKQKNYLTFQNNSMSIKTSKNNRFFIDPKEQLAAQKWARKHKLKVIGNAHSHPNGTGIPSSLDIKLTFSTALMLIADQFGVISAWWITEDHTCNELKLIYT